jgi:hypothetical protein
MPSRFAAFVVKMTRLKSVPSICSTVAGPILAGVSASEHGVWPMTNAQPVGAYAGEIKVLDHGFVRVVDRMGDDSAIVQAARSATAPAPRGSARTPS